MEIDDVDDADANVREVSPQQGHRGQCLQRRHVAGACHDDVRIIIAVARPMPDTGARGAMANGRIAVEPLPFRLLAGDDKVDVVAAAQTVIGHRQQAVRVRRQIDAHDVGFLVRDMIDEARILMGKAVVVLAPDVRSEQIVQRRDRLAPRDRAADLQPFGVLVEHRIDDMDEGLVAGEKAVAARQQIAFEPALAQMFAQNLHDAPVRTQIDIDRLNIGHPCLARDVIDGFQPVRCRFIRPEQPEIALVQIELHHIA